MISYGMCSRSSRAPIHRAPSISFRCEVSIRMYSCSSFATGVTFSFFGMNDVPAMTCRTYAFHAIKPRLATITSTRIVPKKIRSRRICRRRASGSLDIDRLRMHPLGIRNDMHRFFVRRFGELRPPPERREEREEQRGDDRDQHPDAHQLVAVLHHDRVPAGSDDDALIADVADDRRRRFAVDGDAPVLV